MWLINISFHGLPLKTIIRVLNDMLWPVFLEMIFKYCYLCVLSRSSHVWVFATQWTAAHQAPLCMGFPRQEYCCGFPPPGESSWPRDWTRSNWMHLLHWQAGSLPLSHLRSPTIIHFNNKITFPWHSLRLSIERKQMRLWWSWNPTYNPKSGRRNFLKSDFFAGAMYWVTYSFWIDFLQLYFIIYNHEIQKSLVEIPEIVDQNEFLELTHTVGSLTFSVYFPFNF